MSIKLINHRRRLLHKNSFHSPAERKRKHNNSSNSKLKANNVKKNSKDSKIAKNKTYQRDGLKVPYNYNHIYEDFIFSNSNE